MNLKAKCKTIKLHGNGNNPGALDGSYVRAMKGKADTFCLIETHNAERHTLLDVMVSALLYQVSS